jgi:hypothetical protein
MKRWMSLVALGALLTLGAGCSNAATPNPASTTMQVRVSVPNDDDAWQKAVVAEAQEGVKNATAAVPFVTKTVDVPRSDDPARAAADWVVAHYGPSFALVSVFVRVGDTQYVLLNIDEDGYAGVSFALAKVRPVLERTLLLQPGIAHVVFGRPPAAK